VLCLLWERGDLLDLDLDVDFGETSTFGGQLGGVKRFAYLRLLNRKTGFG
jgi:hypothetical protein